MNQVSESGHGSAMMLDRNVHHVGGLVMPATRSVCMKVSPFRESKPSTSWHKPTRSLILISTGTYMNLNIVLWICRWNWGVSRHESKTTHNPQRKWRLRNHQKYEKRGLMRQTLLLTPRVMDLTPLQISLRELGLGMNGFSVVFYSLTRYISFMSLLFTDSRWREQNLKLLQNLSKSSTIPEMSVQPNSLPSAEEALIVFNT